MGIQVHTRVGLRSLTRKAAKQARNLFLMTSGGAVVCIAFGYLTTDYYFRIRGDELEFNGFWALSSERYSVHDITAALVVANRQVPSGQVKALPHLILELKDGQIDLHPLMSGRFQPALDALRRARPDLPVEHREYDPDFED